MIVNWLIGIFLVCVFLYILYSAWRMYLRIQYYTMQNKSAMEEKKEASSVCNKHDIENYFWFCCIWRW